MVEIDLLSVASYCGSQPHDQFAWLRDNDPVHWHEGPAGQRGFWAVTRYEDVATVGRDHETFSSAPTIMLEDPDADGGGLTGDKSMMLTTDPPVQTRMRRLVSREFTPRAASALGPRVDEFASRIVDEVIEQGSCDLVTDLAGEMPSFVIADVLGIPLDDGRELYHHTETIHSSEEVVGRDARGAAVFAMFNYAQEVYRNKTANPGEDLATLIINGVIDGEPVDEVDFFLWFLLLIDAGGDTTRNLVGGGFHALFEHPDQLAKLRNCDDAGMAIAVEELLRWVSPVVYMRRTATRSCELGGRTIAEGDKVVMYYGSANRDPRVFDQPERLDLGRTPNPHVAFGGGGPHFCLGSHLARIEIIALLREILRRLPDIQPAGEATWMNSNFIYGPTSLPVRFSPA